MIPQNELNETIARDVNLRPVAVAGAVQLLDEGNTIPFIARYRKERTGSMDEEQLRAVAGRLEYLRTLMERKETVLASIREQGHLTTELEQAILAAETQQAVEDLYLPYRPRRRTRATAARERGLAPLAETLLAQPLDSRPESVARRFVNDDVPDVAAALAGARDIVAEQMAETATLRQFARERFERDGGIQSRQGNEEGDQQGKYELYYEFSSDVRRLQPHQVLALNRGESEKVLRVQLTGPDETILSRAEHELGLNERSPWAEELRAAVADGYARLLRPAVERDVRRSLTEEAEHQAILAFQKNLRNLLLQPPLRAHTVLGIDPAYRTGCKLAVCDPTGRVLTTGTVYPHPPQKQRKQALETLAGLIQTHRVTAIAVGNGTASRETEQLVADLLAAGPTTDQGRLSYAMVNEAGASVYSASPLARRELPDLDVSIRGAVSIARRLQDPLAELVKIDPKSIGVGLYQHDVDQKRLAAALDAVVESVVNGVGVNLNTASAALLVQVSGLSARMAENIVQHRNENGPFQSRRDLLNVTGIGPKAFEQAAGFLRIPGGKNPLDNTGIHPESYPVVRRLVEPFGGLAHAPLDKLRTQTAHLARELSVGEPTLIDILAALARPGRDPRDDLPPVQLRSDVLSMEDLAEGMILTGTVRNVVAFGAFVDIGVKQDGLVHISEMADRFVRDPHEIVAVGDVVQVRILSVDPGRGRIGLSMVMAA